MKHIFGYYFLEIIDMYLKSISLLLLLILSKCILLNMDNPRIPDQSARSDQKVTPEIPSKLKLSCWATFSSLCLLTKGVPQRSSRIIKVQASNRFQYGFFSRKKCSFFFKNTNKNHKGQIKEHIRILDGTITHHTVCLCGYGSIYPNKYSQLAS